MPISRFDSPAQFNAMNTFVANPIPFQELMQAGDIRAKEHESGLARLNQGYETVYNTKYNPGDEANVKNEIGKAQSIVDQYTKSGQDLGDPVSRQQMIRDLNTKVDHDKLRKIESSAENIKEYSKKRAEMEAKKELDPREEEDMSYTNWNTNNGVFNKIPKSYNKDYQKTIADTYYKNVGDEVLKDSKGRDITDWRGRNREGVTDQRIAQETLLNVKNALSTDEGQILLWEHRKKYPEDNKLNDQQAMYNAMYPLGHQYVRNKLAGQQYEEWQVNPKGKENNNPNAMPDVYSQKQSDTYPNAVKSYHDYKKLENSKPGTPENKVYTRFKDLESNIRSHVSSNYKAQYEKVTDDFIKDLAKHGFTGVDADRVLKMVKEGGPSSWAYTISGMVGNAIGDKGIESLVTNLESKIGGVNARVEKDTEDEFNGEVNKSSSSPIFELPGYAGHDEQGGSAKIMNYNSKGNLVPVANSDMYRLIDNVVNDPNGLKILDENYKPVDNDKIKTLFTDSKNFHINSYHRNFGDPTIGITMRSKNNTSTPYNIKLTDPSQYKVFARDLIVSGDYDLATEVFDGGRGQSSISNQVQNNKYNPDKHFNYDLMGFESNQDGYIVSSPIDVNATRNTDGSITLNFKDFSSGNPISHTVKDDKEVEQYLYNYQSKVLQLAPVKGADPIIKYAVEGKVKLY